MQVHWGFIGIGSAALVAPNFLEVVFVPSECTKPLVKRDMWGTIIAVKKRMVKKMKIIASSWPMESIVTEKLPKSSIDDTS